MSCKAKSPAGPGLVLMSMVLGFLVGVVAPAEGTAALPLTNETKLTGSDAEAGDSFGASLAVSGETLVVGAPFHGDLDAGAAYVFVRSGGVWSQQRKLTPDNDESRFGTSVAISGDTAIVGATGGNGAAYVFVRSGGVWTLQQKLTATGSGSYLGLGSSVAVSGDIAVVGAPWDHGYSGSAFVFARSGTVWREIQTLRPMFVFNGFPSGFGSSLAFDGNTLMVGAPLDNNPDFGSGSAYVFEWGVELFDYVTRLTASDPKYYGEFGTSLVISGDTAFIGSSSGSAYVFVRSGDVWSESQKLMSGGGSADALGSSVALRGDIAVVGAPDSYLDSGSALVFVRNTGVWTQQARLKAIDGAIGGSFGRSVAVAGGSPVVGAPADSYDAAPSNGSVYVYDSALVRVWVGLKNSDDVGIRFDLQANVSLNGKPVSSGHLDGALGGSSGFNNAKLNSIPLTLFAPVAVSTGDVLGLEILVRNACSGSGKNSGTARLWYDGQAVDSGATRKAGSRLDATIGGSGGDYFLRKNFDLDTEAGSAQLFVDKAAGVRCGAYTSFGTWSMNLP